MSLEAKIAELITALQENTAALNGIKTAAKEKAGSTGSSTKSETKTETKSDAKKSDGKKAPTLEDVTSLATEYMNTTDADERKARKANIAKINEKLGADRLTNLKPSKFAEAIKYLQAFIDDEDPFADEGGRDDDGDSPI